MIWFLVFFLTPIAEMYLLIEVAGYINTFPTVGLVMLTAVIGVYLLRVQGLATLTRGVSRMNNGELPARELAEGVLLAIAGALMVTPGLITDTVGFILLFPVSRAMIASQLLKRAQVHPVGGGAFQTPDDQQPNNSSASNSAPTTIEGDFERRC